MSDRLRSECNVQNVILYCRAPINDKESYKPKKEIDDVRPDSVSTLRTEDRGENLSSSPKIREEMKPFICTI